MTRPPFVSRPLIIEPAKDPDRILRTVVDGANRLAQGAQNLNVWASPGDVEFLAGQADALRRELLRLAGVLRGERKTTKREGPPNAA